MRQFIGKLSPQAGWAVPRPARLTVVSEGVHIDAGDAFRLDASWARLRLKPSLSFDSGVVIACTAADDTGWTFESSEPALLEKIRDVAPRAICDAAEAIASAARGRRRSLWRRVAVITAVLAIMVAAFLWGLRAVPALVAARVPLSWEEALGQASLSSVTSSGSVVTRGPAHDAVETVWKRLLPALPTSPYRFQVTLIDAPTVNALAMPGGRIVVYTGLLEALDGPESLAGILAHESAHVVRQHSVQALVRNAWWHAGLGAVWALFGGSREKFVNDLREEVAALQSLAHSRDHESQADADAMAILAHARIDPMPFTGFFTRLAGNEGRPLAILSTHPPSADRAATLRARAQTEPAGAVLPLPIDWRAVRRDLLLRQRPAGEAVTR